MSHNKWALESLKKDMWCLTYLYDQGVVPAAFKALSMMTNLKSKFVYGSMKNPAEQFLEYYNIDREDLPATLFNYVLPQQLENFNKEDSEASYMTFVEEE